ncbi:rubrerythrin family protein [bacterium]|nr:rubrerythrin family protein [bacterium]
MASLKGSQTEKNLLASFAGESQARNRYTYFASVARKEGYEQIAFLFEDTANNEKEHAKVFFKYLEGGDVEITAAYPAGAIGDTLANLKAAAAGEKMEWGTIYPEAARVAKEEGFTDIASSFTQIAAVEAEHEARYNILAERVEKGGVFSRPEPIKWRCRNCGRVMEGKEAPQLCPACKHPQAHYEPFCPNY